MVSESITKSPIKLFELGNPKEFIGEALEFHVYGEKKFVLGKVAAILWSHITQGKLIVIRIGERESLYEIVSFDQPDNKYNYFKTISLVHKGNL